MARKASRNAAPIEGSAQAKKTACALLEVLSGMMGPTEAAEVLSISLPRYYTLETRALAGFVRALEPLPKGKGPPSPEQRIEALMKEKKRLKSELDRAQALVRMAKRTVGLAPAKKKGKPVKKRGSRARKVLSRLRGGDKAAAGKEAS